MKQKLLLTVGMVCLTLFLAACGQAENASNDKKDSSSEGKEIEKVAEDTIVATVNGEVIKGSQYNDMYSRVLMTFQQYGKDNVNKEEIKNQTLDRLIEKELLLQEANETGIVASEPEIEERLEQIKSQFESEQQFQQQLSELEMTKSGLENQIAFDIKVNKYLEKEVPEADVTEKEIQAYYDQLKAEQQEQLPALEEVKGQIKRTLQAQEQQANLASLMTVLKEDSTIEKMI